MAVLPILMHPDPMLRRVCDRVTGDVTGLADDMLETMYAAEGRGLSAPQVGFPLRMFVFDAGWKAGASGPHVCINPEVEVLGSERSINSEMCLSIPGHPVEVERPARVRLRWIDTTGHARMAEFDGDAAVIVQHEADHMDGRLVLDHEPRP